MAPKKKLFNHNENPIFNAFVHIGMGVKILAALGMIVGIWYYL